LTTLQVVELCHLSQLMIHDGIMFVQQTTSYVYLLGNFAGYFYIS